MAINTAFIIALIIVIVCIIFGARRGFLRGCISIVALILSVLLVPIVNPPVTNFLSNRTGLDEWISGKVESVIADNLIPASVSSEDDTIVIDEDITIPSDIWITDDICIPAGTTIPAGTELPSDSDFSEYIEDIGNSLTAEQQNEIIEMLPLPDSLKESLEDNNNSAAYGEMGVSLFTDYLGGFVSDICLNIIGYLITFIIIFFALHLLTMLFKVIDRIPVIHGINHFAGALLGIVKGLLFVELLLLALVLFTGTDLGADLLMQVESNGILSAMYHNNIFITLIMRVVESVL